MEEQGEEEKKARQSIGGESGIYVRALEIERVDSITGFDWGLIGGNPVSQGLGPKEARLNLSGSVTHIHAWSH